MIVTGLPPLQPFTQQSLSRPFSPVEMAFCLGMVSDCATKTHPFSRATLGSWPPMALGFRIVQ